MVVHKIFLKNQNKYGILMKFIVKYKYSDS